MSTLSDQCGIYSSFHRLTNELHTRIWSYLSPLGVSQTTFSYLLYIDSRPGCKVSEMVDALHMDKATATRGLSMLGRLGYINRQTSKLESRAFIMYLTPAGKTIVQAVAEIIHLWENELRELMGEKLYDDAVKAFDNAHDLFLQNRIRNTSDSLVDPPFTGITFFY